MASGKKTSLIKQRYHENPFATDDGFRIPLRRKSEVIQTTGPAAITVGEERISVAEIRNIKTVDSEPFVKLFVDELDRFYDLTPTALRVITILIRDIGKIRLGDGDQVYISERSIADTMQEHGLKPPSPATYYRAMEELIAKGFVAPSTRSGLFFINPAIFFNGDRVRFVTEIRKKRQSRQEKLEEAGQQRLALEGAEGSAESDLEPETQELGLPDEGA